jgi:hypothetical protein
MFASAHWLQLELACNLILSDPVAPRCEIDHRRDGTGLCGKSNGVATSTAVAFKVDGFYGSRAKKTVNPGFINSLPAFGKVCCADAR